LLCAQILDFLNDGFGRPGLSLGTRVRSAVLPLVGEKFQQRQKSVAADSTLVTLAFAFRGQ